VGRFQEARAGMRVLERTARTSVSQLMRSGVIPPAAFRLN
jgi:hypothetical protein